MKKTKTLMLLVVTMLMLAVVFCMNASAAEWTDAYDNAQYTFDVETGVMVIKGEGKLNGSYFSKICPDHYAPEDSVFGCYCQKNNVDYDPPEADYPGYEDARATKTLIIQEGVTAIDVRAFCYFSNLEVAILPQSLTEIPAGAFDGLKKLNTVVLSNSVATIGEAAFYNCADLKNIYMADTLKSVGKDAFYGCDKEVIRIPSSAKIEAQKPDPVKNLSVSEKNHTVTLSWDKSSNAEGYVIEIEGKKTTTKATSYTINTLTPSKSYYFYVTPYLTYEGKVVYGQEAMVNYVTKPEAPKVSVSSNSSSIKLNWTDKNDDCTYIIYVKTADGKWKAWARVLGNSYEYTGLESGTKETFAVRPVSGYKEVLGDYTTITAATKPSTVTAKTASPSKGKLTLTWNKADGDIDGYQVYYKTGNGSYKLYYTYTTPQNLTFSGLKSGIKYTFAVRAGIKTSDGVVWGGYKEASVTVK